MKFNFTFSVLILALATITFFSCQDDEDPTLVGSWKASSSATADCSDADDNFSITFDSNGSACETTQVVEICVVQTFEITATQFTVSSVTTTTTILTSETVTETETEIFTYTTTDDTITLCQGTDCTNGTYTVTANSFTLVSEADEDDGCVTTFSATRN